LKVLDAVKNGITHVPFQLVAVYDGPPQTLAVLFPFSSLTIEVSFTQRQTLFSWFSPITTARLLPAARSLA